MKKHLSFLLTLSLIFVLVLQISPIKVSQAADPVDGGAGDATKIGKVNCILKSSSSEFSPGLWQVSVLVGTDKFFYVKKSIDIPPVVPSLKNMSSATDTGNRPVLTYKYASLTNRIFFSYQGSFTPDQLDSHNQYSLTPFPYMQLSNQEKIYTVSSDGTKYYPFDWSNLNDANMPACTGEPKSITPPSCSDGIQNQGETGVDTGGPCGTGGGGSGNGADSAYDAYKNADYGTCSDSIMNSNETGVDTGGRCSPGQIGGIGPGSSKQPIGHWYSATSPTRISIKNNLSPVYSQFVPRALRDWNQASSIVVTENGSDSIQIPVENNYYGDVGWVGVANIKYNGDYISSATVRINDTYMKLANYKNPEQQQFVVTHEIGHALGVGHQDPKQGEDVSASFCNKNMGSVMDYTAGILGGTHTCGGATVDFGISNLNPNPNDIGTINDQNDHHH